MGISKRGFYLIKYVLISLLFIQLGIINARADGLLSDTVDVYNYEIHLDITNFSGHVLSGYTVIEFSPKFDNLSHIPFQLWSLNIDSAKFGNTQIQSTDILYDGLDLRIPVLGQLLVSDTAFITIYYHGVPQVDPSGWGGFNFESSMAYNLGVGFGADPHNLGKAWFPCIDDFIDRATYDYYITTDINKTAVCSGMFIESQPDPNDSLKTIHYWQLEQEIPTYLASVAVGNYSVVSDTFPGLQSDIPVDIFVQSSYINNVQGSFVNLQGAFDAFEYRFGEYIWPRIGYVGTSIGAMEHQCNIAYPYSLINGNTTYESTMAHELGHSWFGNNITCASSGDMWINEGWASFCEFIFMEEVHGKTAAKNYIRNQHADMLRVLQHTEGWIALADVTHDYTYSNTVYDKGADMVHSMRGYLGDNVFFDAVKELLLEYHLKPISIPEFRDFMSTQVPGDMNSFFESYIYSIGWNHFSVDSIKSVDSGTGQYEVDIWFRQRLKEMPNFANDNRLKVTFMDSQWNTVTLPVAFDGEFGLESYILDFNPEIAILDLEEEFSDATTDYYSVINSPVVSSYTDAYFKLEISQIIDSAFLRVEHNWIAPDNFKTDHPEYLLSDSRYWRIDGIIPNEFIGQFKFYYNNKTNGDGWLDYTWFTYPMSADSLVLLYRSGPVDDWVEISSEKIGNSRSGWLVTDTVEVGEYAMAWKDNTLGANIVQLGNTNAIRTYPNPVSEILTIEYEVDIKCDLIIYNSQGQIVFSKKIKPNSSCIKIDASNFAVGVYIIDINSHDRYISNTRFVVSR